ncbi:MAG: Cna B-type domain-containing protein [Clostridia bacterium]|nr:Cna B-type domain-containing protein [Clostridia bacterium]
MVLNADNNWQYSWDNLPVYVNGVKIDWSVKETMIGPEAAKADGSFINWLVSYELPMISTDVDGNENTLLTIINTTKRVMLRLTKTDLGKTTQLSGATFILEAVDADGKVLTSEVSKTATTGAAGTLVFDNLKCGVRYRLTETEAPSGYLKTNEYIYFVINEDGTVSVEESFYAEAGSTAYNLIVRNGMVVDLPESGSNGTSMFYALGLLLMAITASIYIRYLRKRRCHD